MENGNVLINLGKGHRDMFSLFILNVYFSGFERQLFARGVVSAEK